MVALSYDIGRWASFMFDWVNTHISLLMLVVQTLTLLVLAWTLWWLRRYTLAAEEQVEA